MCAMLRKRKSVSLCSLIESHNTVQSDVRLSDLHDESFLAVVTWNLAIILMHSIYTLSYF